MMCKPIITSVKIVQLRHRLVRTLQCLSWAMLPLLVSCINEDLSDCGSDYKVKYDVQLVTKIDVKIDAELTTQLEQSLAESLKKALGKVFNDHAHDVDLSFYLNDHSRAHHETHVIEDKTASYTLYLPVRNYKHLATANDKVEPRVKLMDDTSDLSSHLQQQQTDTVDSHEYGLFSARLQMSVEDRDQQFYVPLYMQNSVAVLMVENQNIDINSITGYLQGMADEFHVADSLYSYNRSTLVRTRKLDNPNYECLYGVSFPSHDDFGPYHSKADGEKEGIWNFKAYVTLPNGKVTETILHVREPLKAGEMKIIKGLLKEDGSIVPLNPEVGASVELDWKEGGTYEPEL